ncbi:unnamed protein product [Zymoseptoria tritici ST99CH_3D1]|uniref:Mitochondrial import inner membrane translocase subunit TIM16 n=1 Tax=Zymoseptoria tritici ST99CH_1E4 TaxID=1276532 RepID=A0A2H1G5H2_ZYMTR|nr:unnamed protein product [Zymoseptoria tritici ST99CH_1E4]SMR50002.1 unnamed protein product [Zymoseptoria tritici ST99CH_3D1]
MAHRIITQMAFTGARVLGRAFTEAYKQASASQKYAQAGQTGANTLSSAGLTLSEACQILNVPPPKAGTTDLVKVHNNFKRLFDLNDPKKGGSFYIQSKVLRARERLELEAQRLKSQTQQAPPSTPPPGSEAPPPPSS